MDQKEQIQFSSEIRSFSMDNFETEVIRGTLPVIVDFWAPWCGPCRVLSPIIDQLAQDFADRVVFGKVNIDENEQLARELNIQAVPTVLFFSGEVGSLVTVGVKSYQELSTIISQLLEQHTRGISHADV